MPTAYVAAVLLLTDAEDRVLVVKPNYRPYWALPGGVAEAGERPQDCAEREVAEELGVVAGAGELLVVHWSPPQGDRPRPMITFVFDGGTLANPDALRVQREELDDARWVSWEEAAQLHPAMTAARIPAAREARRTGRTVYLAT